MFLVGELQNIKIGQFTARAGDILKITYLYDAPDVSPMYYTVGGLSFVGTDGTEVYNEGRTWGIANDNPGEVANANLQMIASLRIKCN